MVVNLTANIGLAKPTDVELAENWVNNTQLQDDNNDIIVAESNLVLTSYTPVFTAQTTPPNVGAGSIKGEYIEINGWIFGSFAIHFLDPGVVVGVNEYAVSLPFPVDGAYHNVGTAINQNTGTFSCIGEGYYTDATSVTTSGILALDVVTVAGVSYVRLITEAFTGKTNRLMTQGQPLTFATNDRFSGSFMYKKA